MKPHVLILGCGPAGLMAAHAAERIGANVAIFSKPRKSFMKGAQYLHRPIPGATEDDPFQIDYVLKGSAVSYRLKVYGPMYRGSVSPEDLSESHSGWDIRQTYDHLWDEYGDQVMDWEATPLMLDSLIDRLNPDLVVSTVPAPLLCAAGHTFRSAKVYSSDKVLLPDHPDNTVLCNAEESPRWYRYAKIQGHTTVEWPDGVVPPITPMWEVVKPTDTNCDCYPDVLRAGRYGKWQKGVLSHEAFFETTARIGEMLK